MFLNRSLLAALAVVAVGFFASATLAEARLAKLPAKPVSLTKTTSLVKNTGDCCAPAEPVCCPPKIHYRHRGPKLCCGCEPGVETILKVKNPCTGCEVDVPVCVPACCQGEPTVCAGRGFLGRDVVEYEWCCGYSVRVAFKHCGDLLVTTWGR